MKIAEDLDAITQLKARYFRLLDTADWSAWRLLFTDDASLEIEGVVRTPDELLRATQLALEGGSSIHRASLPEIQFTGPDTATGIWAMEDRLVFADGTSLHGWGWYHDTYLRMDGAWRISGSVLTRQRFEQHRHV